MKGGVSNTISEVIQYDHVSGPVSKPVIKTEYFNDSTGTFVEFENDIESRSLSISNENEQYQVYSFMPPVKTLNLSINNFGQKYSAGNTASEFNDVLKKNTLIRAWSGYELTFAAQSLTMNDDYTTRAKFVHTQLLSGNVCSDITSYTGTVSPFAELGVLLSAGSLGATTYAFPGYYHKRMRLTGSQSIRPTEATLITSSNELKFKYRTGRNLNMLGSDFSTYTTLATGSNAISLNSKIGDKFIEYFVRFENTAWSTSVCVNTVSIAYNDNAQFFKQGTFITDDPKLTDAKTCHPDLLSRN